MKTLAFLLALVGFWGSQDPQETQTDPNKDTYQNLTLAMKFNYPKTWEIITDKQGQSKFLIPIAGTSDRAVIEVSSVNYRGDKDTWQISQRAFNKSNNRETSRQWEEEILGVPLLLTSATFTERGSTRQTETGLIYSLGFNKMLFRLTASPDQFANVDYAWRQVLQSLRTWTGELPKVEDQRTIARQDPKNAKSPGKGPNDDIPHPQVPHEIKPIGNVSYVKSPLATSVELNGQKVDILVPADWKLVAGEGGSYTLTNPLLDGPVQFTLSSAAATVTPEAALAKASGQALADFTAVDNREDQLPKPNRAGMPVATVWRVGKSANGALITLQASGQAGDAYIIVTYRTTDTAKFNDNRRVVESLLDRMSIETSQ